jgi:glycosyltransferase involved in cell wall biosynthesis
MKVGFDATVLHGRKSGVGYYCEELFKAMVAIDHETDYFVFSHKPLTLTLPAANGNVRIADSKFCPVRAVYLHALLPQLLAKEKPTLCHYTNFLGPIFDSTPYVVTVHDMGLERLRDAHPLAKRVYTRPLVPRIAQRARLIITNSEYSKWEIVRYLGIPTDRIRVTPLAAAAEFQPMEDARRRPILQQHGVDSPYLLYVGNLEPRKNLQRLLEAFAALNRQEQQLVIVGNQWYRGKDALSAAQRFGICGRVRFLGYVPREHLPALYSGATAFVYPSLLEGFGMPVVEAMACGAPVVTSGNSALKEIAGGAARLVDPLDVHSIRDALADVVEDARLRADLSSRGVARAAQYSWQQTASLTLEAYREAGGAPLGPRARADAAVSPVAIRKAIQKTVDYAAMFQYPLRIDELHERLFNIKTDVDTVGRVCTDMGIRRFGDFITPVAEFPSIRSMRENITDKAVHEVWPHLKTLAGIPFIRMIAFSGATAHRNMSSGEDVDLFIVAEDGKLWATFLMAAVWAKIKGLRRRLCMNYLLSDRALPLYEHDAFTAQQAASIKPIFGKAVYDAFIAGNPFIVEHFPNFQKDRHRSFYQAIRTGKLKAILEVLLRYGPIQLLESASRAVLSRYLQGKTRKTATKTKPDVALDARRLKLHLNSHRTEVSVVLSAAAVSEPQRRRVTQSFV